MINSTIKKWGNSSAIRIPAKMMKEKMFRNGESVVILQNEVGIIIKKSNQINLDSLCSKINNKNKHNEIILGKVTGKELW